MDRLLEHCTDTAAWLAPYTTALGAHCCTPSWCNPAMPSPSVSKCCVSCQDLTYVISGLSAIACIIQCCSYSVGWADEGRGSPAELWRQSAQSCEPGAPLPDAAAQAAADCSSLSASGAAGALLPGGVLAHAHGAEVMPDEEASRCESLLTYPV